MRNKKSLFLPLALFFLLLAPASAQACTWNLFTFLFGCGREIEPLTTNVYYKTTCQYQGSRYTCERVKRNVTDYVPAARERMREYGYKKDDMRGGCQTYKNGCRDCAGPEHPMSIKSPGGFSIMISKPGQNRLQPSIIAVLKKLADTRDKNVSVTSGFRSCDYQRRRGVGVSRSQHLMGKAADFLFVGAGPTHSALAKYARETLQQMGIGGGTGTYCSAPAHVDTGNNRQWNWCGGRGK